VLFAVGELMRQKCYPLSDKERCLSLVDQASSIVGQFVAENPKVPAYRLFRLSSSAGAVKRILHEAWRPGEGPTGQLMFEF
jgi:hypothetical protein